MYSFSGNCVASVPISPFMCMWAIYTYIPRMGPHISCSRICRSIVGIYKSLTMWDRDWCRAIPFLGIHKCDFLCSASSQHDVVGASDDQHLCRIYISTALSCIRCTPSNILPPRRVAGRAGWSRPPAWCRPCRWWLGWRRGMSTGPPHNCLTARCKQVNQINYHSTSCVLCKDANILL